VRIELTVNGEKRDADVWAGESLLYTLREQLGLPGSKNACEQGECGSCSVLLDGKLVCACLVLAAQAEGHEVVTVEGLGDEGELHRVQEAFAETGAVQCGFCTPGLIVATAALLEQVPDPSDDQIREALSGNLCRCTGYAKIFDAVHMAAAAGAEPVAEAVPEESKGPEGPEAGSEAGENGASY
jgi:aerobic carbon-monoxide dehydrogenase small subunit